MKDLGARLTAEFGAGFSRSNLEYIRRFYLAYPERRPQAGAWFHSLPRAPPTSNVPLTFNAKPETLTTQPTWREPFKRGRRCLVRAERFYEWKVLGPKEKQPYAFTVGKESISAFAGLWDAWHDKQADVWLKSLTILTTTSNELTRGFHTRMPVILHTRDYDEWLLRDDGPPPLHLLRPYPAAEMQARLVSRDVGNVKNNHPELLNSK